jgi:hypothetical protein
MMAIGFQKLHSLKNNSKKMKKIIFSTEREVTLDGMMTVGKLETGLRALDFQCCEDVVMKAFCGLCKVQVMRDGNVYITESPKRIRNKPLFRDDNSSLSLGQNGQYYFVFTMPQEQLCELPQKLVRQASAIAEKVLREVM